MYLPVAELRDFRCHCHTIGSVGDTSVPTVHIPVKLTIECLRIEQQDEFVIRRWLAQHPLLAP